MGFVDWAIGIAGDWVAEWTYPYIKGAAVIAGGWAMTWMRSKNWPQSTPILYGLVTATCLYVFLFGIASSRQEQPLVSGFTTEQIEQLKLTFLSLPRPCFVKVTAAEEHIAYRKGFLTVLEKNYLNSSQERHETIIKMCETSEDEKDRHPELYEEEISAIPKGMITVSGFDNETVRFLVDALRKITSFRVRPGKVKPDGVAENWIYIQIGTGPLVK